MNGATHEVPLSRGRYLNLKTGDIGLRDANSLWTFELQREYIPKCLTLGWAPYEEILEFFDDIWRLIADLIFFYQNLVWLFLDNGFDICLNVGVCNRF